MQRSLDNLTAGRFDVLVIGGGITGACLAYDLALRGLEVALIERGDFGGATSSASSKLLHGGIRYLQQLRVDRVRESARERQHFLRLAPHLITPVPFLVPTYARLGQGRAALRAAFAAYRLITAGLGDGTPGGYLRPLPQSRQEVAAAAPPLARDTRITGGFRFSEAHMVSSERMTLAFVKAAAQRGTVVANYVEAVSVIVEQGAVRGVIARDTVEGSTFRIDARVVANAGGPWIPLLNATVPGAPPSAIRGYSKGVHIVTRPLIPDVAVALPTRRRAAAVITRGGRHVFVIPWRGHSLIGTSDAPFHGPLDAVHPTAEDVDALVQDVQSAMPDAGLTPSDVRHAFAGLYPLRSVAEAGVYKGTGDYHIVDHGRKGGPEGLVTVLGAKYTTARRVAEYAGNLIARQLRSNAPCRTTTLPLPGGDIGSWETFVQSVRARHGQRVDDDRLMYLARHYGTEIDSLLVPDADCTPLAADREPIAAEVTFAVTREMAVRLDDVVFRRTGLG
ncbi:MAG TPA: glycerol-3-phosphate dehydrogenase/oxidase, partial [Vicinamibacterales bacterium]